MGVVAVDSASVYGPLEIPTPDGNPSIAHPSVVHVEEGWSGYVYWMAFTPYPGIDREDPCIVASTDGMTWEVPAGSSNPIDNTDDIGISFWSDPHLLLLANGTMRVYYRGGGGPVYFKDSDDGVTWTARTACTFSDDGGTGDGRRLSPSIVQEDDGTFVMWTVDSNVSPNGLYRLTSADGTAWSGWAQTALPALDGTTDGPWHAFVARHGGRYHALVQSTTPYRLYYFTSVDGETWVGDGSAPAIPLTPFALDDNPTNRHYRSTMVPRDDGLWDLWVNGIDASNANANDAVWRVAFVRGVDLSASSVAARLADLEARVVALETP